MLHPWEITGVVLAGGKSSRFGTNKALQLYKGKTFLQHIIGQLESYTNEVVIAGYYPEYENEGITVLEDKYKETGPLGGIYTALSYCKTPWILVLTCDMPFITGELIQHMLEVADEEHIIGWQNDGKPEAFPMLLSKKILPALQKAMDTQLYKVKQLYDWGNPKLISIPQEWQYHFNNINDQTDLKQIIIE